MSTVSISTHLDASPERLWDLAQRPSTLVHVAAGLLRFSGASDLPPRWEAGFEFSTRLWIGSVVPLPWRHRLRIVLVDHAQHRIVSEEGGGPVHVWNHRITIVAEGPGSRYVDEVDIHAGHLTAIVVMAAHILYRYRQARWRRLARSLAATVE